MDPTITRNLVRYLVDKDLLTREEVVDGGLALTMSRSRNRFVMVKRRSGASYFIKQAIGTEPGARETIAREAEIYRGAFADERLLPLRALLPAFRLHDSEQHILINDLIPDGETIAVVHSGLGACPVDLAGRLGGALAAYHRIRFVEGAPQAGLFPQQEPWILKLHTERDLAGMRRSAAASELVDILLAAPRAGTLLAELRASWKRDTLIHTDMRWENCLLAPRSQPLAMRHLYVIDWELADIGDAAWDVGSMLQSYLTFWIASMPKQADLDLMHAGAKVPLGAVQPAIGAFWDSYISASDTYRGEARRFLDRCVGMLAARMMVTAFERCVWAGQMDPTALVLVQTALNILERPGSVAAELLGITEPAPSLRQPARAA